MKGTGTLFLSVVIVNWNGRHLLKECLDSILAQGDEDLEVIVVDNGSRDGSPDFLKSHYARKILLIELATNEGWSGGNNKGIESSHGEYVLLLNNDVCLGSDFFRRLREGISMHPGAGMYATKILNYHDRSVIDNTGHVIFWDGTARGRGRRRKDGPEFGKEEEVLCPSGAAGVYKREIFENVGPIDDDYFTYGEDTELGLRARQAGYRCYYLPSAVLYHKYSASGGPFTPRKIYYVERNRVWTVIKLFPWYLVAVSPVMTMARYVFGLYGLVSGKGALGKLRESYSSREAIGSLVRAYADALRKVRVMWRKRRSLRETSKLSDGDFVRMLYRFSAGIREVSYND
ncbi:MAG: glycosyltransferase family 2 protein [Deltaproteobacteria bacterium]|nr:glycosyltransferase family 2 protein [Deltaproteobacteria bacterium]